MTWADALALLLAVAGIASVALATLLLRDVRAGLIMALDLWMAASLLQLAGVPSLSRIASAAVVVAIRKFVLFGLQRRS